MSPRWNKGSQWELKIFAIFLNFWAIIPLVAKRSSAPLISVKSKASHPRKRLTLMPRIWSLEKFELLYLFTKSQIGVFIGIYSSGCATCDHNLRTPCVFWKADSHTHIFCNFNRLVGVVLASETVAHPVWRALVLAGRVWFLEPWSRHGRIER